MNQPVNQRTAGVVDPILSTHARGYRNLEFIGHLLFPRVTVPTRSMRVLKFGKESFRMLNTRRAPGADKMVTCELRRFRMERLILRKGPYSMEEMKGDGATAANKEESASLDIE